MLALILSTLYNLSVVAKLRKALDSSDLPREGDKGQRPSKGVKEARNFKENFFWVRNSWFKKSISKNKDFMLF